MMFVNHRQDFEGLRYKFFNISLACLVFYVVPRCRALNFMQALEPWCPCVPLENKIWWCVFCLHIFITWNLRPEQAYSDICAKLTWDKIQPEIIPCKLSVITESFDLAVMTVFRAESRGLRVTFVKGAESYFLKAHGCDKQGAFQ